MPLVRFSSTQRIKTNMNSRCRGGTTWNRLFEHFSAKMHHWSIDSKNYQASNWPQYIMCSLEANKTASLFHGAFVCVQSWCSSTYSSTKRSGSSDEKHGLMNFSWKFHWENFRIMWNHTNFLLMLWKVYFAFSDSFQDQNEGKRYLTD